MESGNHSVPSTSFKLKHPKDVRMARKMEKVKQKSDKTVCIRSIPKLVKHHSVSHFFPRQLQVKVVALPRGEAPMLVADNSGMIPLFFVVEALPTQQSMKLGASYKLIQVGFDDLLNGLLMRKGSFAVEDPQSAKLFREVKPLKVNPFTTKDLLAIESSNVMVDLPLLVKIDNIYNLQHTKHRQEPYRNVSVRDEFNSVKMTGFRKEADKLKLMKIDKIYSIQHFKVNVYYNKANEKQVDIVINPQTTLVEIDPNSEQVSKQLKLLKSTKTNITGIITNVFDYKTYQACSKCKRYINSEMRHITFDLESGTSSFTMPKCQSCGQIVDSVDKWYLDYYVHLLVVNGDDSQVVITNKDQMCHSVEPKETIDHFFKRIRGCWVECLVETVNEKNYCRNFVLGRKMTTEFDQEEMTAGGEIMMDYSESDILDDEYETGEEIEEEEEEDEQTSKRFLIGAPAPA